MDKPITCPKCGQPMKEGYVPEMSQAHTGRTRWIPDPPEVGFLGLNTRGKDILEVRTFRCLSCGYLESYAWK
jgi:predicted nucleic-acid-binding Zn-ribbon protein